MIFLLKPYENMSDSHISVGWPASTRLIFTKLLQRDAYLHATVWRPNSETCARRKAASHGHPEPVQLKQKAAPPVPSSLLRV